jgi:predicted GH43/DUF377 family glycosyl hydrolase
MGWGERRRIFEPQGQAAWIGTHAALPVVQSLDDGYQRLFFSSRDGQGRSHIGYVELSLDDPDRLRAVSEAPVLSPGALGAFDDAGVTTSCLIEHGGAWHLYYTGWSLGVSVPFYLFAGVAISEDGGQSFRRLSRAPLLDRTDVDPFLTASPWVLIDNGIFRMWYVSGTEWNSTAAGGGASHRYHIRYAESKDGHQWDRRGIVCIDYASPEEYAFGRPCVIRDGNRYRMWYSYRGTRYRLGYAESADGVVWTRMDSDSQLVLPPSEEGWDSEMMTYPLIVRHRHRLHMLYNGNGYGRTGIGLARHVSS